MSATAELVSDWPTLLRTWRELDVPEGWRAEITEWGITMTPPPMEGHAAIANLVNRVLARELPDEWQIHQTVGLVIRKAGRLYIPDFLVMGQRRPDRDESDWPPDVAEALLVVEITSPSNASHDRRSKLMGYARGGVPLYLLVDRCHPKGKRCTVYSEPRDGDYQRSVMSPFGAPVHLPAPFDLDIDTSKFE